MGRSFLYGVIGIVFVLLLVLSYFMFFQDGLIFQKNETKIFQIIKMNYELNNNNKALDLSADFLALYPESKLKNKVIIIAASICYDKHDLESSKKYLGAFFKTMNYDNSELADAAIICGKILKEQEIFDPMILNNLEDAYLKISFEKRTELSVYLGYAYLYKKDYLSAIRYFNEAIGEYGIIGIARVYIEQGKYPEAIQEYQKYFSLYPVSINYHSVTNAFLKQTYYYANYLKQAKKNDEAVEFYLKIIQRFPNTHFSEESIYQIITIFYEMKDYTKAQYYIDKLLNNSVLLLDDHGLYQKAIIYYDLKKYQNSIQEFNKLLNNYPDSRLKESAKEWLVILYKGMKYQ